MQILYEYVHFIMVFIKYYSLKNYGNFEWRNSFHSFGALLKM